MHQGKTKTHKMDALYDMGKLRDFSKVWIFWVQHQVISMQWSGLSIKSIAHTLHMKRWEKQVVNIPVN